jgi:hypothetical protein
VAGGLMSHLRSSDALATLFREEVVLDERRRYDVLLARAAARGELPAAAVTPLFGDLAGSLIFTRALIAGEPLDRPVLEELVDNVLLPISNQQPKDPDAVTR